MLKVKAFYCLQSYNLFVFIHFFNIHEYTINLSLVYL